MKAQQLQRLGLVRGSVYEPGAYCSRITINPLKTLSSYRRPRGRRGKMTLLKQLLRREEGATAIEYGLIAALISIACIVAFQSLGLNLANIFTTISNAMSA